MSEYYVCLDCETPCYVFEEDGGQLVEILCPMCGNARVDQFLTEDEHEGLAVDED